MLFLKFIPYLIDFLSSQFSLGVSAFEVGLFHHLDILKFIIHFPLNSVEIFRNCSKVFLLKKVCFCALRSRFHVLGYFLVLFDEIYIRMQVHDRLILDTGNGFFRRVLFVLFVYLGQRSIAKLSSVSNGLFEGLAESSMRFFMSIGKIALISVSP